MMAFVYFKKTSLSLNKDIQLKTKEKGMTAERLYSCMVF